MTTPAPIVDWHRLGRRLRFTVTTLLVAAVLAWLVVGATGGALTLRALAAWIGAALGALFVAEVVLVGGSALRGMLRAGERGHRLAGGDVGMLPPQLGRRPSAADDDRDPDR